MDLNLGVYSRNGIFYTKPWTTNLRIMVLFF